MSVTIRPYRSGDEESWLRCRVLALLHSPYFDDVRQHKDTYINPSIELVAVAEGEKIVGILDIELETDSDHICYTRNGKGCIIWHLAVHPDYRRKGIATQLHNQAVEELQEKKITKMEVWTREDTDSYAWYENHGFNCKYKYQHVYATADELANIFPRDIDHLRPVEAFFHYTGREPEQLSEHYQRVHNCCLFVKIL